MLTINTEVAVERWRLRLTSKLKWRLRLGVQPQVFT